MSPMRYKGLEEGQHVSLYMADLAPTDATELSVLAAILEQPLPRQLQQELERQRKPVAAKIPFHRLTAFAAEGQGNGVAPDADIGLQQRCRAA